MSDKPKAIVTLYDSDGNGRDINITDSVAVMYDALLNSMDWGSNFLDVDQIVGILTVGKALGFDVPSECGEPPKDFGAVYSGVDFWKLPMGPERYAAIDASNKWRTERLKEWCRQVQAMADAKLAGE